MLGDLEKIIVRLSVAYAQVEAALQAADNRVKELEAQLAEARPADRESPRRVDAPDGSE